MTGCLEPVFEAIDGFRRIYPDLPGMGASPVPAGIENADDMLDALIGLVNSAIGKERFLLIGESYGAYMSFGLALRLRDQIEGMFLICPAVEADSSKRDVPEKELLEYDDGEMEMVKRDEGYDGSFLDYAVVATQETWLRYKSEIIPGVNAAALAVSGNAANRLSAIASARSVDKSRFDLVFVIIIISPNLNKC
jgi:pimeloyl-ACP methyl ester carboxylesterase